MTSNIEQGLSNFSPVERFFHFASLVPVVGPIIAYSKVKYNEHTYENYVDSKKNNEINKITIMYCAKFSTDQKYLAGMGTVSSVLSAGTFFVGSVLSFTRIISNNSLGIYGIIGSIAFSIIGKKLSEKIPVYDAFEFNLMEVSQLAAIRAAVIQREGR